MERQSKAKASRDIGVLGGHRNCQKNVPERKSGNDARPS